MTYLLWFVSIVLIVKCVWNSIVPYAVFFKMFGKEMTGNISMFLALDLFLLFIVSVLNFLMVYFYTLTSLFERYSFLILSLTVIFSYAWAWLSTIFLYKFMGKFRPNG